VKVILDLFTVKFLSGFVNKPIYLFGGVGTGFMSLGFVGLVFLFVRRTLYGTSTVDSPIFLLSALLFILGIQSILMGLLAEMSVRTYHESQSKPIYTVRYVIRRENGKSR
jgi:hypothetical protein